MSNFHEQFGDTQDTTETPLQGYLLSGEAISRLSLDELAQKLGELGLEPEIRITPVADVEGVLGQLETDEQLAPVPATYETFRAFADRIGATKRRGGLSWWTVERTYWFQDVRPGDRRFHRFHHRFHYDDNSYYAVSASMNLHAGYPPVRFVGEEKAENQYARRTLSAVDLRSVHERLVASDLRPDAWHKGTRDHVAFLATLVNEVLEPSEPLPVKWTKKVKWTKERPTNS